VKPATRSLLLRLLALALVVVAVPGVVALGALSEETAIVVGEPAPRTIVADRPVQVVDEEATAEQREQAANLIPARTTFDGDAAGGWVQDVAEVFAAARAARVPVRGEGPGAGPEAGADVVERVPSPAAQVDQLLTTVPLVDGEPVLDRDALRVLVSLDDTELVEVQSEAVEVTQSLAQAQILLDDLTARLDERLPVLLSTRSWPDEVAVVVVEPLVRGLARATQTVDNAATERLREEARDAVETQVRTFAADAIIVSAGDRVDELEFQAIDELGLVGSRPGVALLRALVVMAVTAGVVVAYLRGLAPEVWRDATRVLVLGSLVLLGALLLVVATILAREFGTAWWYVAPVGGTVLLATVLVGAAAGVVAALPLAVMALLVAPQTPGVVVYTVAAAVVAAPLAQGVATRLALRRATLRMVLASPLLAATAALVFGPRDALLSATLAGAVAGLAGFGLVQSLLPAYENVFRLATVTSLLDLADRNHPLLRELEDKALGSYNHSVMVANLTERACRAIGANDLLGQVAALYHDIGKVRQPHFFIENQRGIGNPHDDLEPRVSAVIIQNHVKDGVEMATEHRLPPDVVDCIASHHGTMLVTYFYREALAAAGGDESAVDEAHFRYKGHRPRSKEAAVLLLADCSEATTRSMAMDRGTLPSDEIGQTVDRLLRERLEDGQFDDCQLTFVELRTVRDSIVEALTGIYHPRIAYPSSKGG
jgi:hypothetical protein